MPGQIRAWAVHSHPAHTRVGAVNSYAAKGALPRQFDHRYSFASAMRRSELVALNVSDLRFEPFGAVRPTRRARTRETCVNVGKTKLCAVRALQEWLDAAGITEGAVFRSVGKGGCGASVSPFNACQYTQ